VLKGAKGDVVLRINSGGGDVFNGLAIHADLEKHKNAGHNVRVEVSGIAASIASIIAMAGSEIVMAPGAFMMVHNAWTVGIGNRHDLAEVVSTLTKIDDVLANIYTGRTKSGIRTVRQMMNDETWLTAKEAVDAGFATSIADGAQSSGPSAKFDLSVFGNLPDALKWPEDSGDEPVTIRELERALTREAKWPRSKTRAALAMLQAQSIDEPARDAGKIDLTPLAEAVKAVSAILKKI
jgi:ATP-dependent Clp protease protease subunit